MIEEYIILTLMILLVTCLICSVCAYYHYKKISKIFAEDRTDYPKSMVALSESKILEIPARKEKFTLYVYENGQKKEFKIKKWEVLYDLSCLWPWWLYHKTKSY